MTRTHSRLVTLLFVLGVAFLCISQVLGQDREQYLVGENGQLEMIVHIIGEVERPGEYRVGDSTNLMELISKAGGPTEFSDMGRVTITRLDHAVMTNGSNGVTRVTKGNKLIKYNVKDYLKGEETSPPALKPGDIVLIPRNSWHRWRSAFTVIRDLSVIASVYFLYRRSVD